MKLVSFVQATKQFRRVDETIFSNPRKHVEMDAWYQNPRSAKDGLIMWDISSDWFLRIRMSLAASG